MKLILNSIHKLSLDPITLDAVIKSPSGGYNDIQPDLCFMCDFMRQMELLNSGGAKDINVISSDGSITLTLKVVYPTETSTPSFFLSINGVGGDVPIKRENIVSLQRALHRLYFEYAY